MKEDVATRSGCVRFAVKYFGTITAAIWIALTWDMVDGVLWRLFIAAVCYLFAIPWGLAMWWFAMRRR
jgi:hypothetical protein